MFVCPIRTIKGRGNNYTTQDATARYCPTNAIDFIGGGQYDFNAAGPVYNEYNGELQWELDPDNNVGCLGEPDLYLGRPVFAICKNTCPGGETETVHINSL